MQNLPNFLIEIFPESVIVNGAVVNVRNRGDKISMWLCETKPQESIIKIGQTLKRRLGIDDKVVSFLSLELFSFYSNIFKLQRFSSDLNATMIQLTKLGLQPRANTQSNGMEDGKKNINNLKAKLAAPNIKSQTS